MYIKHDAYTYISKGPPSSTDIVGFISTTDTSPHSNRKSPLRNRYKFAKQHKYTCRSASQHKDRLATKGKCPLDNRQVILTTQRLNLS